jgi:hypothetical protein
MGGGVMTRGGLGAEQNRIGRQRREMKPGSSVAR